MAAFLSERFTSGNGDKNVFIVNDGTDSYGYYFAGGATNAATIDASELSLINIFDGEIVVAADVSIA